MSVAGAHLLSLVPGFYSSQETSVALPLRVMSPPGRRFKYALWLRVREPAPAATGGTR